MWWSAVLALLLAYWVWVWRSPPDQPRVDSTACCGAAVPASEAFSQDMRPHSSGHLQVETLNTWGLWLVAKRRRQRFACLAQHLSKTQAVRRPQALSEGMPCAANGALVQQ